MGVFRGLFICVPPSVLLWAGIIYMVFYNHAQGTWKPEFSNADPASIAWFKNAQLTPAAQDRLRYISCCEKADRYKTKFVQGRTAEEWMYQDLDTGQWLEIPKDIIHYEGDPKMPMQLKVEGVLFIYADKLMCFWPPESGN